MHLSPRERRVGPLAGEPDAIISRGEKIESIGQKMRESSQVLGDSADRASGQQGKAGESLVGGNGDTDNTTRQADEPYEPEGPGVDMYCGSSDVTERIG